MKRTILLFAILLIALPASSNGQKNQSPEDQIRDHLRLMISQKIGFNRRAAEGAEETK